MEQQQTPREQAESRAGTSRTPDRWLWIGSLLFHLCVFLVLPTFTTEAKQPLQLLIEIVKPEVKKTPLKPSGVKNPKPAAKSASKPVDEQPAKQNPGEIQDKRSEPTQSPDITQPELKPAPNEPEIVSPVPNDSQQTPNETSTTPIPEMVAVPTHQPRVILPHADPVVEEVKPEPIPEPVIEQPAPKEDVQPKPVVKQPKVPPVLPAPASTTGSTKPTPNPPTDIEKAPDLPAKPAKPEADSAKPAATDGIPDTDATGRLPVGEVESAAPPGPSELELGLLGDYGDGARKKIRMLVRTPELAREQGMKGKCTFEFELRSDGTLVSIKVLDSSSHAVLDEECLEATRVGAPFKRFPNSVSVESWKFQMEIVFPTY